MTSQCLSLFSGNSSRQQNYLQCAIIFIENIRRKWYSPLLMFVIAKIGLSVQNTNLHLKVGRSGLEQKLNVIKSQI